MRLSKTIGLLILLFVVSLVQAQDSTSAFVYSAESFAFENTSFDLSNQIEIYPNPSVDYIVISIKKSTLKDVTFELRSIIGNTFDIGAEEIGRDKYRINMKNFTSGYYFVVVKDDFSQFTEIHKFLKK